MNKLPSSEKQKFYITTAIDYVNDTIHLGHAFQKIAADVLARYYRIKLGEENVFFLTGTDEFGKKAEKAAKEEGQDPKYFVKKISNSDQKQQDSLNISYNRFIRTTDPDHIEVVEEIWKRIDKNGDIYPGQYSGLYCEGCEAYYKEEDLVRGECPVHPNLEIKKLTEENYFFKWSKYRDFLVKHIEKNKDFIYPEERRHEALKFAKNIQDIPISRSNFKWGISVPNDPSQVIYVWFDALTNYLTGVGFLENKELFEKFWPADIHVLGKDNLRWHALLWPAMLKSAGIELPKTILVNGFLNIDGQKISKSLGNVIRPTDWTEKYGTDAVRYYLLRYANLTNDSDISEDKLKQAYNSDLANGLGNLVSRVLTLAEKHCGGKVPEIEKNPESHPLMETELKTWKDIDLLLPEYKFSETFISIWKSISAADVYINENKPWALAEEDIREFNWVIYGLLDAIHQIAWQIYPFLPETSVKIAEKLNIKKLLVESPNYKDSWTNIKPGTPIKSGKPLFPRI